MQLSARHQEYWRRTLAITLVLVLVWFVVTFVVAFYARELTFDFLGWPFSFYMAAQGSLLIYGVIIWFYARHMDGLDREYAVDEDDEEDEP